MPDPSRPWAAGSIPAAEAIPVQSRDGHAMKPRLVVELVARSAETTVRASTFERRLPI
jgi:hypothetical protein